MFYAAHDLDPTTELTSVDFPAPVEHPGTQRPVRASGLDGHVELGAAHLVVVAQRAVGLVEESADRGEVART